jgi:hypothetical protein
MNCTFRFTSLLAGALLFIGACTKESPAPVAPSDAVLSPANANADGSLLKATAPAPQSPVGGVRLTTPDVTMVVGNSTARFVSGVGLQYRFQILNAAGAIVYTSGPVPQGSGSTAHVAQANLNGDETYQWWARPEFANIAGPWSARSTFIAAANTGFIRGNEMYDPLINGQTVGYPSGPVTFIPGRGAKLETQQAHISYELPQTLYEGEFSLIVTELRSNTEGGKTKLFAMGKGYDDIVTNEYRMTIEKRGEPPGTVAWRFIARDDQIDTEGAEREVLDFDPARTYFWQATWRSNYFNLLIRDGGVSGNTIYDKGKHWEGRGYEPSPHVLYVGAPIGRSGWDGASVDGVVIRQVYVGPSRPAYANQ